MTNTFMFAMAVTATVVQLVYSGTAPEIRKLGDEHRAIVGSKVIIPCYVTGIPPPIVTWEIDGKTLTGNDKRIAKIKDANSLRIFDLQARDQGNYTCVARNQVGVDTRTTSLLVRTQPQTNIVSPTNLTFLELTNQELVCQSPGLTRPLFEWLTNHDQRIRASNVINDSNSSDRRLYSIDRIVGVELYESVLLFQPITFKDFGSFACVAFNDVGHSRTSITLDVHFSPKTLSQHKRHQHVLWWAGHNTNLTCMVAGNDLPTITWTKGGHPFKCNNLDEWIGEAKIKSTCMIHHRTDGGPGLYTCSAENSLGKILVHEFNVRENFPPSPVEFTPISNELDEITLSVKVPFKEDTPPSTYIIASYKLVYDEDDSSVNPEYERIGDLDDRGEGTVKLVAVRQNREYIVKVRAKNSVGLGPETVRIINTAIQPQVIIAASSTSASFSTDTYGDGVGDGGGDPTSNEEVPEKDVEEYPDSVYPPALSVKSMDNGGAELWVSYLLTVSPSLIFSALFLS